MNLILYIVVAILVFYGIGIFTSFFKKISVPFGYKGYLYVNGKLEKIYDTGNYLKFFFSFKVVNLYYIPNIEINLDIKRQEVLTKDNISLKLNAVAILSIENPQLFIEKVIFEYPDFKFNTYQLEKIYTNIKIFIRELFFSISSTDLLEKNNKIFENVDLDKLNKKLKEYGVSIKSFDMVDIMFPKAIQQLYAKVLDAELRGKYDLENARSLIASLRTMKNASKMIDSDPNLKFILYLETLQKISSKNSSTTMVLGEVEKMLVK